MQEEISLKVIVGLALLTLLGVGLLCALIFYVFINADKNSKE